MADFTELRQQLQQARARKEKAAEGLQQAKERTRRIEAEQVKLDRISDPDNQERERRREELRAQRTEAEHLLKQRQAENRQSSGLERDVFEAFATVTDPRRAIAHLNDQIPILLLPVRLETRFKTITMRDRTQQQLWVRVYPDVCTIDTFEATLSEVEVQNARLYWTGIWQAGGIEGQERAAWRGLVASHGSGRAAWIIANYQPLNAVDKPAKAHDSDVILVVPAETGLTPAEQSAAAAFWQAIWLADGEKTKEDAARTTLEAIVGTARATEIATQYQPVNLSEKPQPPHSKALVAVSVAFVLFPAKESLDTKQQSWSRAPKVTAWPDRFVFIGYAGNAEPQVVIGNPIPSPLVVGPDPSASEEDQLHQENGDISIPADMKWMVDFDKAVQAGMGFRIDLTELQALRGFDRVLVLGLRLSADERAAKAELEALIHHHHYSRSGFSLLPQGTPTNNTEAAGSGFTATDDPDASFDDLFKKEVLFQDSVDWLEKRDGQWLAECLGIDPEILKKMRHSSGTDQIEARSMNIALWPATLGYWMETMMSPVFSQDAVHHTRLFFNRFVSGRGFVPAVRIGNQPYGILPVTAFSRMKWMKPRTAPRGMVALQPSEFLSYLHRLYGIVNLIDADWAKMAAEVSFSGRGGDAHKTLLDIIGLHSGSVEFAQRYGESLEHLYNQFLLTGQPELVELLLEGEMVQSSVKLLKDLGYDGTERPDLLNKLFFGKHNQLKGPVIDNVPLSETDPVRSYTPTGKNYLQWLLDAANTSHDALRAQSGFIDNKPPQALLYLLLRHALQLSFYNVSVLLHEEASLYTPEQSRIARQEPSFIHVKEQAAQSESRYQLLYKTEPAITNSTTRTVGEHIVSSMPMLVAAEYLREQLRALEHLKDAPTAVLERALAEHVDCCTYRFDSWLLGLVHYQLAAMRDVRDGQEAEARRGIYLGAYAWLENVRPENKVFTPVSLEPDLEPIFNTPSDPPLRRDSTNKGYIHAPSLNQAVTAAVLRDGYIANASPANRQTLAVNLTSERVRVALSMLEGIRGGQSLGALLGYQFERGLHDRHDLAEVDKFIYKIRKAFALQADRLKSTKTADDVSIEAIEARNVVDGLRLVNHIKQTPTKTYPFDKDLPQATEDEAKAIKAEVDRLLETHDALADLAIAEGVYQAVQGNFDRVAATMDSYSKGHFPPEPSVVRTPSSGIGLTHRVALHLQSGLDPNISPVAGVAMTPRAQAEPALNQWLANVLPALGQIGCKVLYHDAATNTPAEAEVTLLDLAIQPIDVLFLVQGESEQAMSELDDRIARFVLTTHSPRPDVRVNIRYMERMSASFTIFEVMPLTRSLRRLALGSRALRATDVALSNEAAQMQDAAVFADSARVVLARNAIATLRTDLLAFRTNLEEPLSDLINRRDEIIANVDTYVQDIAALLARVATFGLPQAGWGFAYEWKQKQFSSVLKKVGERVNTWDERLIEFDTLIASYDALPDGTSDDDSFEILHRAERLISTTTITNAGETPNDLRLALPPKRAAFMARRDQFAAILNTNLTSVTSLLVQVEGAIAGQRCRCGRTHVRSGGTSVCAVSL
jgi:hypothetical protein